MREERPDDVTAVREVNRHAFGQDKESNIVDALQTKGGALFSLDRIHRIMQDLKRSRHSEFNPANLANPVQ